MWQTVVAPVLGGLGLLAITAMVLANFTTLIGGSRTTAAIFLAAIVVTFVVGLVLGGRPARRDEDGDDVPSGPMSLADGPDEHAATPAR